MVCSPLGVEPTAIDARSVFQRTWCRPRTGWTASGPERNDGRVVALPTESIDARSPVVPARTPERRSLEHWALLAPVLAAAAAVLVLGILIDPDPRGFGTHEKLGMAPCHFLAWTGFPCPGCGVTTSVSLAAHGRFAESFANQPFGALVAVLVPLTAIFALVQHARRRDLGRILHASRPLNSDIWVGGECGRVWRRTSSGTWTELKSHTSGHVIGMSLTSSGMFVSSMRQDETQHGLTGPP